MNIKRRSEKYVITGFDDGTRGPRDKECGHFLEARKGKETFSSLEFPKFNAARPTPLF